MLNRKNRLVTDKDFRRLFRKGKRFYADGIRLTLAANGLGESRFGFVVGTKVDKRAVVRNRMQRRMREVVRLGMNDIKPGFDGAFVADKKALELDFDGINKQIYVLLKKAKLLS